MILLLIILQAITCATMLFATEQSKKNVLQARELAEHFKWIQRGQDSQKKPELESFHKTLQKLQLSNPTLFLDDRIKTIQTEVEAAIRPFKPQKAGKVRKKILKPKQDRLEIVTSVARGLAACNTIGSASNAIWFLSLCRTWGELTEKETRRVRNLFEVFSEKLDEKTDEKKETKQPEITSSRNPADLPIFHPRMPLRRTCSLPSIPAYLARTQGVPAQALMPLPLPVILTDPEIQPADQEFEDNDLDFTLIEKE